MPWLAMLLRGLALALALTLAYAYLLRLERLAIVRLHLGEWSGARGFLWPAWDVVRSWLKPSLSRQGRFWVAAALSLPPPFAGLAVLLFFPVKVSILVVATIPWLGLGGTLLYGLFAGSRYIREQALAAWWLGAAGLVTTLLAVAGLSWPAAAATLRGAAGAQRAALPFVLYQPLGFAALALGWLAGGRRLPFALPGAGEARLAEFHLQHAGGPLALLHLAEYLHVFCGATLLTLLYLGGRADPWGAGAPWLALKALLAAVALLLVRDRYLERRGHELGWRGWLILAGASAANLLLTLALLSWP